MKRPAHAAWWWADCVLLHGGSSGWSGRGAGRRHEMSAFRQQEEKWEKVEILARSGF